MSSLFTDHLLPEIRGLIRTMLDIVDRVALRSTCRALRAEEPPPSFPAHWNLAASPNDRHLKALLTYVVRNGIDRLSAKLLRLSWFDVRCADSGSIPFGLCESINWPVVKTVDADCVHWYVTTGIWPCTISPTYAVLSVCPSSTGSAKQFTKSPDRDPEFVSYLAAQYDDWPDHITPSK